MEILFSRCGGLRGVNFHSGFVNSCSLLCQLRVNGFSSLESTNAKASTSYGAGSKVEDGLIKSTMDNKSAKEFVENLNSDDRRYLLAELQRFKSEEAIADFTVGMGRPIWGRRFIGMTGGSGSMDPSGRFCEIPSTWMRSQGAGTAKKPSFSTLLHYSVYCGVPFIGFGFLDNVIMITAGDYIEMSMGAAFGIGTMTAAALGNAVSDVAGIGSAFYIEMLALKIGVHPPSMSPTQLNLKVSHWSANIGRAVCLTLGCILGMFPLLFLPKHSKNYQSSETQQKEL